MSSIEADRSLQRLLEDPLRAALLEASHPAVCHLVGGAIRDRLARGIASDDWDLVVSEDGETVARRLARALAGRFVELGGERFSAYRVVTPGETGERRVVDLWDRHGAPLERELRRRDLTVNSIAVDLATGEVVDPLGGRADLDSGLLRANAPERFLEDPLRSLRLLRFAQQLPGFTIEPETADAARRGSAQLETIAAERVRQELDRILGAPIDREVADRMAALDLFPRLWNEEAIGAGPASGVVDAAARLERVTEPTVEELPGDALMAVHHALLLLASGAASDASDRLDRLAARRWVSVATAARLERLVRPIPIPTTDSERRLFIHRNGPEWALAATVAAQTAPSGEDLEAVADLIDLAHREARTILSSPPLLDGHDLQREFGVPPGPGLGGLLSALGEAQAVGTVRTSDEARRWIADRLAAALDEPAT